MRHLFTLRSRATRPLAVLIAAAVLVTGSPNLVAASTLVDRTSMALVLDYGIKADLSYTYGTITAEQRITLTTKAAAMLAGLRARMGSAAFFGAMRELFATDRNGIVTTSEFVAVMLDHGAPQSYLAAFLEL